MSNRSQTDRYRVRQQVVQWTENLIDLTRRNKLLNFRYSKLTTLEIVDPSWVVVVDRLKDGKFWTFYLPEEVSDSDVSNESDDGLSLTSKQANVQTGKASSIDFTDMVPKQFASLRSQYELITNKGDRSSVNRSLRSLERLSNQEFMDKGLWVLYLAVGFLTWNWPEDTSKVSSPLVLIPVTLERESPSEPFRLRQTEDDLVVNPVLSVKLKKEFGVEIPVYDPNNEDDIDRFFRELSDLAAGHKWSVDSKIVLSSFTFAKEVMYRDLVDNLDKIVDHEIISAIADDTSVDSNRYAFDPVLPEELDKKAPPEQLVNILDADSSQLQCIVAAREGRSFVMDGPPGTGKSQTIANIIAEIIYLGKTVLFVSEKAAALDVVYSRLKEAGLADYVLELHSHKATRREVAKALGAGIDQIPKPPSVMDEAAIKRLLFRRRELSSYATAMNSIREPLQKSVHFVIGTISQLGGEGIPIAPIIAGIDGGLDADRFARIYDASERLSRSWDPIERGESFVWRDLAEPEQLRSRQNEVSAEIDKLTQALDVLKDFSAAASEEIGIWLASSTTSARQLSDLLVHLSTKPGYVFPLWLSTSDLHSVASLIDLLKDLSERYFATEKQLSDVTQLWQLVSSDTGQSFQNALEELSSIDAGFVLTEASTLEALSKSLEVISSSVEKIALWSETAVHIARELGLRDQEPTLKRTIQVAQLLMLSRSPHRTESQWLDNGLLSELRHVETRIKKLVGEYWDLKAQIEPVFTDDVLKLDLASLIQRFSQVYRGAGKLKSSYRNDKNAIKNVTRTGKVTKEVVDLLSIALKLRVTFSQIELIEEQNSKLLGHMYYKGVHTDFKVFDEVITLAETAVSLAGDYFDPKVLARVIGYDAAENFQLIGLAGNILQNLRALENSIRLCPFDVRKLVETRPLLDVGSRWREAIGPLTFVVETLAKLDRLPESTATCSACKEFLSMRLEIDNISESVAGLASVAEKYLGEFYKGYSTDFKLVESSLSWVRTCQDILGGPLSESAALTLLDCSMPPDELNEALNRWSKVVDNFCLHFLEGRGAAIKEQLSESFDEARELLDQFEDTRSDIFKWKIFKDTVDQLNVEGLEPIISFAAENRISAIQLPKVIERAVLASWLEAILENDPRFQYQQSSDRDVFVKDFSELDRQVVAASAGKVMLACNRRRPRTNAGVASIIRREAEKKKRHMPVRDLISKTAPVTQAIKPCFMMSPLSVSQFLSTDLVFDTVIFDEASQVRPGDAINCIYRGKQLIIAGDQKQLPPTAFFAEPLSDESDSYEEGQLEDYESILDHCKGSGAVPSLSLRWHYRSQHEDLIAFSNYSFYDGRLVTFPSSKSLGEDVGLEMFRVDGTYRRAGARDNLIEAEKVVERIFHHARTNPNLTLGVVAFSEAQASAIYTMLDVARKSAPEFDQYFSSDRLKGVFVKNLESVQGDERDIIIFSIGYGRDEFGKLTMNFGPINNSGGQRRLNVAITRARRRVEIVSSIGPEDFTETGSEGVRHLRRYLDFAVRGIKAIALDLEISKGDAESPFEEEVIRVLTGQGYDIVPQVGTAGYRIDIGVLSPGKEGQFILGVECDGAMYHSSSVARDRDRLRQEVLEGLGWRLHRIWGTSWYRNRNYEIRRLIDAGEAAINDGPLGLPAPKVKQLAGAIEYEEHDPTVPPLWTKRYEVAKLEVSRYSIGMESTSSRPEMKRLITETVRIEGPVHRDIVLGRLREAWGVKRTSPNIKKNFQIAIGELSRDKIVSRGEFLYSRDMEDFTDLPVRIPVDDRAETRRGALQIPPEELENAVLRMITDLRSSERGELLSEVARIFGWQRKGMDVVSVLTLALERLINSGKVQDSGDRIQIAR